MGYAYEGKTIKLNKEDYDQWRESFYLLDLKKELDILDPQMG
jgi:hypothetical protein